VEDGGTHGPGGGPGGQSAHGEHGWLEEVAFAWQKEYGVLSIREARLAAVVRYVKRQEEQHARNATDGALEGGR